MVAGPLLSLVMVWLTPVYSGYYETEHAALRAIYHSTLGYEWPLKYRWPQDDLDDHCNQTLYPGVTCANDNVVELIISFNRTHRPHRALGSLPSSIGHLSGLSELLIQYSTIGGNIPTEIGQLRNLTTLGLTTNEFTGTLPSQLWTLSKLDRCPQRPTPTVKG